MIFLCIFEIWPFPIKEAFMYFTFLYLVCSNQLLSYIGCNDEVL